jgi:hypothetical protein
LYLVGLGVRLSGVFESAKKTSEGRSGILVKCSTPFWHKVSYQNVGKPLIFGAGIAVALDGYREEYNMVQGLKSVLLILFLFVPLPSFAGDSSPTLTVTTLDARLYPRQDNESKFIATLEKGEKLQPLARGVGSEPWYMVKSSKGMIGWVQATEVNSGNQVDETFKDTGKIGAPKQQTGFLSECLAAADEVHKRNMNRACRINERHCSSEGLDVEVADSLMRDRRAARDESP